MVHVAVVVVVVSPTHILGSASTHTAALLPLLPLLSLLSSSSSLSHRHNAVVVVVVVDVAVVVVVVDVAVVVDAVVVVVVVIGGQVDGGMWTDAETSRGLDLAGGRSIFP